MLENDSQKSKKPFYLETLPSPGPCPTLEHSKFTSYFEPIFRMITLNASNKNHMMTAQAVAEACIMIGDLCLPHTIQYLLNKNTSISSSMQMVNEFTLKCFDVLELVINGQWDFYVKQFAIVAYHSLLSCLTHDMQCVVYRQATCLGKLLTLLKEYSQSGAKFEGEFLHSLASQQYQTIQTCRIAANILTTYLRLTIAEGTPTQDILIKSESDVISTLRNLKYNVESIHDSRLRLSVAEILNRFEHYL